MRQPTYRAKTRFERPTKMDVQRLVEREHRLITLIVSGVVTDDDLSMLIEFVRGDDVESDFGLLVDLREADGRTVTASGVRSLAMSPLLLSRQSRRAVVVPSALGYGMARMYEMLRDAGGGGVSVFRAVEQARRWVLSGEE